MNPVRGLARDKVASPKDLGGATSNGMKLFNKTTKEKEKPETKDDKPVDEQAVLSASPSLPKGGDASSYRVVLSPHITEKGTIMSEQNKYVFRVAESANKLEIKKSIKGLYKVDVAKVMVSYARPKIRKTGKREGHKPGFKKAIVTLKEGSKIDIAA